MAPPEKPCPGPTAGSGAAHSHRAPCRWGAPLPAGEGEAAAPSCFASQTAGGAHSDGATWMGHEGCRSREAVLGTRRAQEGPQRVWPSGCLPPALRPPPWGASFSSAAGQGRESPDPSSELWTRQLFVTAPWDGHSSPLAPPQHGAPWARGRPGIAGELPRAPDVPGKGPAVHSALRKTSLTVSKPEDVLFLTSPCSQNKIP